MIEVSAAASRLILSGIMERHPRLKIVMSHTGGALPYQSGRMDKNTKAALLPQPRAATSSACIPTPSRRTRRA